MMVHPNENDDNDGHSEESDDEETDSTEGHDSDNDEYNHRSRRLCRKSRKPMLDTVSTTCDSGWVRSPLAK
jgi:hypothetical protein